MTVDTDIVNRALQVCGARSTVANLQERSKEALAANLIYAPTRRGMLRSAHWNFARAAAYLSLLKSAPGTPENTSGGSPQWSNAYPQPPWLYSYAYPSDCLKVRYISPQINVGATTGVPLFSVPSTSPAPINTLRPQPYLVATDTDAGGNEITIVLTNQDQAISIYTRDVLNPGLWDDLFQEAMVCALASRLAIPLAGDKALKKSAAQDAMQAIQSARVSDGNEGTTIQEHVPDWIRTRGFTGDWSTNALGVSWDNPSFLAI